MEHLSPQRIAAWLLDPTGQPPILLDVREPWEFEKTHIAGSISIPMSILPSHLAQIEALQDGSDNAEGANDCTNDGTTNTERAIVCICHHGARSMQVAAFLERQGLCNIVNLTGGVHAWANEIDPTMPRY